MAQDSTESVVTYQSLQFMRNHPPPSPSFQAISSSVNMDNLHAHQQVMAPAQQGQWIPSQWIPSSSPVDRNVPLRPIRPVRPMRPRRQIGPVMFPRAGPRMWRGTRFLRNGQSRFNPMRKTHRFQIPHKPDEQQSNVASCTESTKANCATSDSPNRSANVAVKVEAPSADAERCVRSGIKKRKPISKCFPAKPWNRQDAEKALKVELEAYKKQVKTLIIKFPDPELSWDIIRSYHSAIEKVHFQVPTGPRYCFIQLSDESDVDEVIKELKEIEFHNLGKITVEKKCEKPEAHVDPESIDPYTLYIGNLPLTINPTIIKEKFPTAAKIDVGYAKRMKYTRYAFVRYQTVEESIEAFQASHNVMFDSRNLIVRFRRQKGKNCLAVDLGTKLARREKRNIIQRKRNMEDLKKLMEKKIKKEKVDNNSEGGYEPTLSDLIGSEVDFECEQESEEEEKEVDDDDDEDDDDDDFDVFERWKDEEGTLRVMPCVPTPVTFRNPIRLDVL